jgi:hypothetical protein
MLRIAAIIIVIALAFTGWTQFVVGILGLAALWMLLSPD